ncbi:Bclov3 [Botrytis cinerea B05.10]|uniref:Bclov3 n=1 Tax=Botryotinia fuckeliana (strain B05.10) TaxID=332648 RepID=A0A384JUV8_BOTFB|nr:Bclov3 [Botrytis cinerea B05.10]ATZ54379.1 Bclov3 [Botrytis cinerea B05.10]
MSTKSSGFGDQSHLPQPLQRKGRAYGPGVRTIIGVERSGSVIGGNGDGSGNGFGNGNANATGNRNGSTPRLRPPPILSLFPHPNQSTSTTSAEMNMQGLADRRKGALTYAKNPGFTLPTKIDEASTGEEEEEGGAEVNDIPFYKPYRPGLGGPHLAGPSQASRSRRHSLERGFDSSSPRRGTASPTPSKAAKILQAQVGIPLRTSSSLYNEEHRESGEHLPEAFDISEREGRTEIRDSKPNILSSPQSISSPSTMRSRSRSRGGSVSSYQTNATSLPALQKTGVLEDGEVLEPLNEEDIDPGSFDLVAATETGGKRYSLETRSEQLFSTEHLRIIFSDPSLLLRFTSFLGAHRPSSIPILIYYLDAVKALKAISYSNAIAEALEPIPGFDFTATAASKTMSSVLEEKAAKAFDVLVREDLPAYITWAYIQTVSISIQRRITGTLPAHLREASEGLAEVFCLTDPSRPDNPIVFASEEFHRTTQYGMSYVLGRNCRFLQGPKTNPFSVRRIREKIEAGQEHCETFLNYRRDGSPFMNLLMCAPLCDSRGTIRYFIGAQVDISGLVKECSELESLQRLVAADKLAEEREAEQAANPDVELEELPAPPPKDEFQELSEMLNMQELDTVRKWGGRMHKETEEDHPDSNFQKGNWHKPRLHIKSTSPENLNTQLGRVSGKLGGIYENYLLVRPYPSLRVLFASPTLRVPGILQSPFMAKIGGSNRVREELTQALADGRGVTAKVRWVTKDDLDGRPRWIHCTPLIGSNGLIGVWMIVIVDDEASQHNSKRYRLAPAVDPRFGRTIPFTGKAESSAGSIRDFSIIHNDASSFQPRTPRSHKSVDLDDEGSMRSGSPYTLRID